MQTKRKDQTLTDFIKSVGKDNLGVIPIDSVTQDEFRRLTATDGAHQILNRMKARGTSRDLTIESAGVLDDLLKTLIVESGRPLAPGSFSSKIDYAGKHNLVSADDRNRLHAVCEIANAFRHNPHLHHFVHDDRVRTLCDELKGTNEPPLSHDQRFGFGAYALAFKLIKTIEDTRLQKNL